jgi:histidine triad (HIT) family protein
LRAAGFVEGELSVGCGRRPAGDAFRRTHRIAQVSAQNCTFCKIVAGELPATIVDEDEHTIAFMDINPATRGHALVVPRRHADDLMSIDRDELAAVIAAAQRLAARAKERLKADGINVINSCGAAAWQTVFHFHLHVIPRYERDALRLPWVPAPGDPAEIAAAAAALGARAEPVKGE